jgi:hypothetical protein
VLLLDRNARTGNDVLSACKRGSLVTAPEVSAVTQNPSELVRQAGPLTDLQRLDARLAMASDGTVLMAEELRAEAERETRRQTRACSATRTRGTSCLTRRGASTRSASALNGGDKKTGSLRRTTASPRSCTGFGGRKRFCESASAVTSGQARPRRSKGLCMRARKVLRSLTPDMRRPYMRLQ